jgi:hypothetical protein
MDEQTHNASAPSPGYETHDANTTGVFRFLIALAIVLVASGLVCWGMFRVFTAHMMTPAATDSPFADTRQLPLGPQLQVNPREDYLRFREDQQKSLETLAWENRSAGIARVPIEEAMELLVKKGVPVQGQGAPETKPGTTPAADSKTPSPEAGKKP